jgi:hypothetical protein
VDIGRALGGWCSSRFRWGHRHVVVVVVVVVRSVHE